MMLLLRRTLVLLKSYELLAASYELVSAEDSKLEARSFDDKSSERTSVQRTPSESDTTGDATTIKSPVHKNLFSLQRKNKLIEED